MWLLRNSHQHDTKDEPRNFKKLQLLQEIKDLYAMKEHMLCADRDIFATKIETRETHTIMQLQEYTKFAKQITKRSKADAKEHGKNFKKIDHYFPTKLKREKIKVTKEKTIKKTRTWKRNIVSTNQTKIQPPEIIPPSPSKPRPG